MGDASFLTVKNQQRQSISNQRCSSSSFGFDLNLNQHKTSTSKKLKHTVDSAGKEIHKVTNDTNYISRDEIENMRRDALKVKQYFHKDN